MPARQGFVDRFNTTQVLCDGGKRFTFFAIQFVADTNFDLFKRVEDVQLGERDGSEAVDLGGIAGGESVEPAATARAAG